MQIVSTLFSDQSGALFAMWPLQAQEPSRSENQFILMDFHDGFCGSSPFG